MQVSKDSTQLKKKFIFIENLTELSSNVWKRSERFGEVSCRCRCLDPRTSCRTDHPKCSFPEAQRPSPMPATSNTVAEVSAYLWARGLQGFRLGIAQGVGVKAPTAN